MEELLNFLLDPQPWLEAFPYLELPGSTRNLDFSRWTALNYLRWYDPGNLDTEWDANQLRLLDPSSVPGRRESLERLVYDILELQIDNQEWESYLNRLSRVGSYQWDREVKIGKHFGQREGPITNISVFQRYLGIDFSVHGLGVSHLFLDLQNYTRTQYDQVIIDEGLTCYLDFFEDVKFGDELSFADWWKSLTLNEIFTFQTAVSLTHDLIMRDIDKKEILARLSAVLSLADDIMDGLFHDRAQFLSLTAESEQLMKDNRRDLNGKLLTLEESQECARRLLSSRAQIMEEPTNG